MKFLCDNCKAKYQIADEKVAGKTVRMKCRKCGHQIEVRAAVTETSVTSYPPKAEGAPPRPRSGLATSLSAQKPRAPTPASHAQGHGALAGAFQRNVEQAPSSAGGSGIGGIAVSVTDEWYVAINGVPVGPVRISELRRKAASGAVTEDSLCWQEGLEEWRPVRSVPELAALVREAAQGNRASLVSPEPARQSSPPKPPVPQRPAPMAPMVPVGGTPRPPNPSMSPKPPVPMRSNVVPLHGRVAATAEKIDEPLGAPFGISAAALAMQPGPQPTPAPPPTYQPTPAPAAMIDPFAIPSPSGAAFSAPPFGPSSPSLVPPSAAHFSSAIPAEPARRGVPLWFWPILVLFLGFGVGGAYMLFAAKPQQIVVQVPQASQPQAPTTNTNRADDVPPPPTTDQAPSATTSATGRVASAAKTPAGGRKEPGTSGGGAADLTGLLPGAGGPSVGPGGGPSGGGGSGLDQAAVQRVVRDRSPGVKRTCWERGGGNQKSSANITVSITVAPNGSVSGASAAGDDPVIAKCIEGQVRGWSFPAPGQTSTVNIPFHFVRQ